VNPIKATGGGGMARQATPEPSVGVESVGPKVASGEPATPRVIPRPISSSPPRDKWTDGQIVQYAQKGTVPRGAPGKLDLDKALLGSRARAGVGQPGGATEAELRSFLVELDAVRTPQELDALKAYKFALHDGKAGRFLPPPFAPAPGTDLTTLRHYQDLHQASGLGAGVFDRLCEALSPRLPFLAKVFSEPKHLAWGRAFFDRIGKELNACADGEAAAVVFYYPDCYGVKRDGKGESIAGTGITHISVMALTKGGDVSVNHQESITFGSGARRNLMTGSLGLVSGSFDTRSEHERVAAAYQGKAPDELPVDQSFRLHGGPAGMVTRLSSFDGFRALTEQLAQRAAGAEGLSLLYAADPDHVIGRVVDEFNTGKLNEKGLVEALGQRTRFMSQPDVRSLDGDPRQGHLDYTNNCTFTTLLALKAGGCRALVNPERITSSSSLAVLQTVLLRSELMPYTDPGLPSRAQATWTDGGDGIKTSSFMIMGTQQATQPGKGIPAHIPYGEEFWRSRL